MTISVGGLGLLLTAAPQLDMIAKTIGSFVIICIGLKSLRGARSAEAPSTPAGSAKFAYAYTLSALHPGSFAFYAAFLQQFVDPMRPAHLQLAALSAAFLFVAVLCLLL